MRTSSPYVDGQRVTLLDVNVDALLARRHAAAAASGGRTPEEAKTILKSVPGLKVNLDPELTIEFQ